MDYRTEPSPLFRLWLATYSDWQPGAWNETPPAATALEIVEDKVYSACEAAMFLQGFNGASLAGSPPIWAVAVPVTIRYDGDARPGERVVGFRFEPGPLEPGPLEAQTPNEA